MYRLQGYHPKPFDKALSLFKVDWSLHQVRHEPTTSMNARVATVFRYEIMVFVFLEATDLVQEPENENTPPGSNPGGIVSANGRKPTPEWSQVSTCILAHPSTPVDINRLALIQDPLRRGCLALHALG